MKKNFGFGCMRLPMNGGEVDTAEFGKMVDVFLENGFNYFDTAHGYVSGKSETAKKISISDLFACLNAKKVFHNWNTDYYYNNVHTVNNGKASECIRCGKCEQVCPQHLHIRELLEDVAEEFE